MAEISEKRPKVGLFVTCLVDLFRPTIGFAAVELIEQAGCDVDVPRAQTCCGQPAYNSGDRTDAAAIARQVIAAFAAFDSLSGFAGSSELIVNRIENGGISPRMPIPIMSSTESRKNFFHEMPTSHWA